MPAAKRVLKSQIHIDNENEKKEPIYSHDRPFGLFFWWAIASFWWAIASFWWAIASFWWAIASFLVCYCLFLVGFRLFCCGLLPLFVGFRLF